MPESSCVSFSCNSIPCLVCSGCSALHGVNPNLKKKAQLLANINLNDVIEHTPTESSAGSALLLYIDKKYSYQPRNDLNIYKSSHLESIFVEITLLKRSNIIFGCIYRDSSMEICTFNDHYLNPLLEKLSKEIDQNIFLIW